MSTIDICFIIALIGIWIPQAFWGWLSFSAWRYSIRANKELANLPIPEHWPKLTVLVPAYNEEIVIEDTLRALAMQDYPVESYEILLINDASKDKTQDIADRMAAEFPVIRVINVPLGQGGKGKSRTLNNGLKHAQGELIAVYDADSTPEPDCVRLIAQTLLADSTLVAVNGKVRTRNWKDSPLSTFIAIEFIYFQWIFQGGRWLRFRLSTLMGTNYVIWRDALDILGGFDEKSLVDDTEMSYRIFLGHKRIKWVPYAVGWQQDPSDLSIFIKQRSRWTQGNFYVTHKYLKTAIRHPFPIGMEIGNNIMCYILFVPALFLSHVTLIIGLLGIDGTTISGPFTLLFILAFILYLVQIWFTLSLEKEVPARFYFYAFIAYFSYSQMFLLIVFKAAWDMLKSKIKGEGITWYKTERKKEKK